MKTRIVHTKIWQDEWFCSISRASAWIYVYLLTCSENNICGIFELADRVICFNARVTQTELEKAKQELKNKVVFYKGWMKLINSKKYNNYVTNSKLETALEREKALIPQEVILYMEGYDTTIDTSIYTPNNHKSKTINQIRGGVGGRELITDNVILEVSQKYNVPESFVRSKFDDVCNWEDEKPGRMKGRNWRLTLINWVKKDALKIRQEDHDSRSGKSKISYIPVE